MNGRAGKGKGEEAMEGREREGTEGKTQNDHEQAQADATGPNWAQTVPQLISETQV